MLGSDCCLLSCVQVSQEAGQVVWDSNFFQDFPQFIVIHTVKGFGIVNKAESDVLEANTNSRQLSQAMYLNPTICLEVSA